MVGAFTDVMIDPEANEHVAEFFRRKIREHVEDPAVAETLMPRSLPVGHEAPVRGHRTTTRRSTATT